MTSTWSFFSSPAKRGRGTTRRVVEGARPGAVDGAAPSTASRSPSPVRTGEEKKPRSVFASLLVALGIGVLGLSPAASQEAARPAALPSAPIPYTTIRPARPKARPAPPRPAAATTAAPAAAPATFQPLAAAAPLPPAELEAFVDGVVRQAMASDHIGGVTVSVVQNGQVVLKKGYGFASLTPARPVDPDRTLFRIGSITKTFTWIALLQEIDAGRMRLDGPVNLYLPLKAQVRDQGFDAPVRLRDLMTHTAGFEDRALGHLFEHDYDRERPLLVYLRQERPRRVREPGALPAYSNYGAALAGAAVSNVTGKTIEALVEQEITRPLGLTRTTLREPHPPREGMPAPMSPALARDLADGLRWTPQGWRERDFEYVGHIAPAGSASSTAADMARYMNLLLAGGTLDGITVFGPKVGQQIRTVLYRPAPGAAGWTHGFQDLPLPGGRRGFGHGGATLSFHSNMVLVPDLGLGVFVSANTDTGQPLAQALPGAIVEHFYTQGRRSPPAGSPALVRERAAYEGAYMTTRRAYGGLEGFIAALSGFSEVAVTPDGYLSTTDQRGGARLWAATARPGVFQRVDGPQTIVFQMRNGKAVRFFSADGVSAYERRGTLTGPGLLAVLAALTAIAAVATLVGLAVRDRRDFRETNIQGRASLLQTTQAILWLLAFAGFGVWAAGTGDVANVVYNWPGGWMVLASACALVAAVLALVTVLMLPVIWRGGRRVDSWTPWRKLRFTMTVAIFVLFSATLAYWGALFPWSG